MYRWLSWQQYGCDVVVINNVVSPSTWSIVLIVNATCAYTWRATFAHLEPMHSLTAAQCPIISGYGSKVKDRITCRSIGSGSPRPRLLMNEINCHCSAKYEACKEAYGQWRSQGGARGAPPKLLLNVFFLQLISGNLEVTRKCPKKIPGIEVI